MVVPELQVVGLTDLGWKYYGKYPDPERKVFPKAKKVFPLKMKPLSVFWCFIFDQTKKYWLRKNKMDFCEELFRYGSGYCPFRYGFA